MNDARARPRRGVVLRVPDPTRRSRWRVAARAAVKAHTDVHANDRMAPATNAGKPMRISDARGTPAAAAAPTRKSLAHTAIANPAPAAMRPTMTFSAIDLSNDSRSAGAEREAGGELVLPLERAADEQSRGIAARDEKERDDRRGKRVERRTHIACQLFE